MLLPLPPFKMPIGILNSLYAAFFTALAFAGSTGVVLTSSTIFAAKSGFSRRYEIAAIDPWAICSPSKESQLP